MIFRLEINGLRALAVGLVILFHFRVPFFTGGFVGVDVFFVISGFLMTQIILGRLETGSFSIWRFYLDRMIRIIPALITMVGILLCVCWFLIEPGTFAETGRRAAAAVLFVSNILFTLEAGYFAESSESNLFLHTWSLSVEWQFYILYPIFIALIFRYFRKAFPISICALTVLSFGISFYMILRGGRWPAGAFFLLPSRAWEMLFGGIVFIIERNARAFLTFPQRRALEVAGAGAIFASAFLFTKYTPWPSYPTVLPIVGTSLVILANCQQSSILRFMPLQSVGSYSYSIYLWHWPIVVLLHYFGMSQSNIFVVLGIALAVVIGGLSYHFVERRFPKEHNWRGAIILLATPGTIAFVGMLIGWNGGFVGRSAGNLALVSDSLVASHDWQFPTQCQTGAIGRSDCTIGGGSKRRIAIFGDSHAEMLYPRFLSSSPGDASIEFVVSSGCPPIPRLDYLGGGTSCSEFHAKAIKYLKDTPFDRIVYVSIWTTYFDAVSGMCVRVDGTCKALTSETDVSAIFASVYDELSELIKLGREVYIVLPFPLPYFDLPKEIRKREFSLKSRALDVEDHRPLEDKIGFYLNGAVSLGVILLNPKTYMCSNGVCRFTDEAGRSLYMDSNHIRASVIRTSRFEFLDVLREKDGKGIRDRRQK